MKSTNTTSYDLVAGVNTISLDLAVGEDETIVLGGNGSTAKVYVVLNNYFYFFFFIFFYFLI